MTPSEFAAQLASESGWARAFEGLIGSLMLTSAERTLRTILVTSAAPGEGKTTIATNLAMMLARAGRRILLVDADLRRPSVHKLLRCSGVSGFADLLQGREDLAHLVQSMRIEPSRGGDAIELSVMASGRPSAGGMVGLQPGRLAKALEFLCAHYELVILDSPPVLAVSDALLLAPHVDGVMFVIAAGLVREREAQRAKQRLEANGGHLLGVVVNAIDDDELHPYGRSYATELERT